MTKVRREVVNHMKPHQHPDTDTDLQLTFSEHHYDPPDLADIMISEERSLLEVGLEHEHPTSSRMEEKDASLATLEVKGSAVTRP